MRRYRRWALPAAALFIFFLLITAPAQHLLGWVGRGQVAATGVEGTAWRGRAELISVSGLTVGPVVWTLRPLSLLAGRLEYQLFVQSGKGGGELRLARTLLGSTRVGALQMTLPASEVGRQMHLAMIALAGDVQLDVGELVLADAWVKQLQGQVTWQAAQVLQPSALKLGALQMQLSLRDGRVVGALGDQGGPLALSGEFTMGADRNYRIDALLKPRANADAQLRQALGLLGNPDAQGRYRLQYSGVL